MSTFPRRELMSRTFAGAGALALAARMARAEPAGPADGRKRPSDRVALGQTGLRVSRVGLGSGYDGWNHESSQMRLGADGFTRLVRHAWDRGLNFFDTADMYGTHAFFRKALEALPRDEYVVSTKINWKDTKTPSAAIERFRLELGLDVLDIVLVHCVGEKNWPKLDKEKRTLDAILKAKAKGKVRAVGVSCHGFEALKTAAETPGIDYHLVRINHRGVAAHMDASPEEVVPVLRRMHEQGRAVCGMKIIGATELVDEIDESLKFVLGLGCVDTMIVGFQTAEEIDDFLGRTQRALDG